MDLTPLAIHDHADDDPSSTDAPSVAAPRSSPATLILLLIGSIVLWYLWSGFRYLYMAWIAAFTIAYTKRLSRRGAIDYVTIGRAYSEMRGRVAILKFLGLRIFKGVELGFIVPLSSTFSPLVLHWAQRKFSQLNGHVIYREQAVAAYLTEMSTKWLPILTTGFTALCAAMLLRKPSFPSSRIYLFSFVLVSVAGKHVSLAITSGGLLEELKKLPGLFFVWFAGILTADLVMLSLSLDLLRATEQFIPVTVHSLFISAHRLLSLSALRSLLPAMSLVQIPKAVLHLPLFQRFTLMSGGLFYAVLLRTALSGLSSFKRTEADHNAVAEHLIDQARFAEGLREIDATHQTARGEELKLVGYLGSGRLDRAEKSARHLIEQDVNFDGDPRNGVFWHFYGYATDWPVPTESVLEIYRWARRNAVSGSLVAHSLWGMSACHLETHTADVMAVLEEEPQMSLPLAIMHMMSERWASFVDCVARFEPESPIDVCSKSHYVLFAAFASHGGYTPEAAQEWLASCSEEFRANAEKLLSGELWEQAILLRLLSTGSKAFKGQQPAEIYEGLRAKLETVMNGREDRVRSVRLERFKP